jgi:RNA polymerase sigma factor (sigma-70 family)
MDALTLQAPLRQSKPDRKSGQATSRTSAREVDPLSPARAPADAIPLAPTLACLLARSDPAAIERFYSRSFSAALATARRASRRDESFCLDAVHDAMLRFLKSVAPTLTDEQLDLYLKRCVITSCIDALRAERRRVRRDLAHNAARCPSPSAAPDEHIIELRKALRVLDHLDQDLIASRFARGHTLDRAGEPHGLTGAAAHGRVRRALSRLRTLLQDHQP